jgi:hypothetical protein
MADEGSGVPSVCLISGIQSLGSMPGQPAASLSTNRSPVQSSLFGPPPLLPVRPPPSLPPDVVAVVDPFLSPVARPGAAGTPPPNGTLELLPNPLSFSALEIRSIL